MSRYVSILGYGPSDSTMGECLITIPLIFCETLSTSIVVFLSTPVWCSLPSPYGPSFHLSVIFIHHLCLVSSPHYWVSLFHTQNSDSIPKSQNSYPTIFPINPSQPSSPKSQNSYPLIIPKSRKFNQGGDLLYTSVGPVGSFCTAVLCRSWRRGCMNLGFRNVQNSDYRC